MKMSKDGSSGESGCQESSSAGGSPGDAAAVKDLNASIYESKEPKKIVRIITVLAYMFSVSFVAIVLSAYYLFLWEPPNPRLMHGTAIRLRADPQLNFLRVELPSSKHSKEIISFNYTSRDNDSFVGNNDRENEKEDGTSSDERTVDYESFEESLTSLKTNLAELIRERNNDNDSSSAIVGRYIFKRGNEKRYERNNENINSRWEYLRGSSYDNTTRVIGFDRPERMDDELEDRSFTDQIIYNLTTDDDRLRRRRRNETSNYEEGTQIEKVTPKSTTTNDTITDDSSEMSTTGPREKSLLQILTEGVKSKELSSSFASTEFRQTDDDVTITEPYEENESRN